MNRKTDHQQLIAILPSGAGLLLCALFATGCNRASVTAYDIPKEQPRVASPHQANPHGGDPHGGMAMGRPALPQLKYTLPSGWQDLGGRDMRVANFRISGEGGQTADVAVIPLPVGAGQDADIFNFWRTDQAKLPPISNEELSQMLKSTAIGTETGPFLDVVSDELLVDGKFKRRLLVAVLTHAGQKWNFRMSGPDELVASQKGAYTEFLKSVSFEETDSAAVMASAGGGGSGARLPDWQVPSGWTSQPPGQMLLATFGIADEKLGKATVTVSSFPGDVGGLLANVNRWRTQVGVKPVEAGELEKELTKFEANGLQWTMTEVLGTAAKEDDTRPMRLIGALTPRGGETWFFKMTGDDAITAQQRDAFLKFVKSVSFDKPAAPAATATTHAAATSSSSAAVAAAAKASGFSPWTVPPHWKVQPPGQMLLATFAIEDAAGKATLTVSAFPGDVGGVLANVNRWRGQIGLGPIEAAALDQEAKPLDLPAGKALLVDATGRQRVIGAMLPHDGQTWYFKLTGDAAVAGKEKDAFLVFLKSLKFDHAH
jgi:stage V sporulation protein SpoVS